MRETPEGGESPGTSERGGSGPAPVGEGDRNPRLSGCECSAPVPHGVPTLQWTAPAPDPSVPRTGRRTRYRKTTLSPAWFCGPGGLGKVLRSDFASVAFPVDRRFHQEVFAMR